MHILIIITTILAVIVWYFFKSVASASLWQPNAKANVVTINFILFAAMSSFVAGYYIHYVSGFILFAIAVAAFFTAKNELNKYYLSIPIIAEHSKELAIRKKQLITKDRYGNFDYSKWAAEKSHFSNATLKTQVGDFSYFSKLGAAIDKKIDELADQNMVDIPFSKDMSPIDYEFMVSDILNKNGWSARVTKATGDQGVDVIAKKNGKTVAIQCKLYSNPVGNAAVQEIIAGKTFESADYAVVVTNSTYTPSAIQLAQSANVLLLHHDNLPDLESRLA